VVVRRLETLEELGAQVLSDLNPAAAHGLPWLCDDIGTRVLLSDYLVGALATASQAFREAGHALDGLVTALRAFETRTLGHLRSTGGTELVPPPSSASEREDLDRDAAITEFFRAIGTLMDNMAAAVAIVGALDLDVVHRFTWPSLENALRKWQTAGLLLPEQAVLAGRTLTAVERAGPDGWLTWALAMRNMLVHRPRRLWLVNLVRERSLQGSIVGIRARILLPSKPAATDIEVMRWGGELTAAVINESADDLMRSVVRSLEGSVSEIARALLDLYGRRATNDTQLIQPLRQWRGNEDFPPSSGTLFRGYAPEPTLDVDALLTGPDMAARLAASAVTDSHRDRWLPWMAATAERKTHAEATASAEKERRRQEKRALKRQQPQ
jgi:hypothetical protein